MLNSQKTCLRLYSCEARIGFEPLEIETPFLLEDFLFQKSRVETNKNKYKLDHFTS